MKFDSVIYVFVRNGAAQGNRSTEAEALDYARRSIGWDLHFGRDRRVGEFGDCGPIPYRVETMRWTGEKWECVEAREVSRDEAIMPFTARELLARSFPNVG